MTEENHENHSIITLMIRSVTSPEPPTTQQYKTREYPLLGHLPTETKPDLWQRVEKAKEFVFNVCRSIRCHPSPAVLREDYYNCRWYWRVSGWVIYS